MAKIVPSRVRSELAKDLRDFGRILTDEGIIGFDGKTPFEEAANECQNNYYQIQYKGDLIRKDDSWGYSLKNVIIRLDPKKLDGIHPSNVQDVTLEYDIDIIGVVKHHGQLADPLHWLNFNIMLNAKSVGDDKTLFKNCWHLDRDIVSSASNAPEDAHPRYHFHFGGNRMDYLNSTMNYGSTLFLGSPRVAHKPLDGILATDFILSNYHSEKRKELLNPKSRSSYEYRNILRRAQERIWRPYAIATSKHWEPFQLGQVTWSAFNIWPQLMPVNK
ncbi:hypothetical protein ACSX1A_11010 [Pontibacter sp. MBLB2868]|uniref:hypothetical protein n=1 Tax=Pontibacter sp. MBLB2868 TaxID=3451555 RepID=UPI003F74B856